MEPLEPSPARTASEEASVEATLLAGGAQGLPLDLDAESRRSLEFDHVLEAAAARAVTGPGAQRVLALAPLADAEAIEARHASVSECLRHLDGQGRLLGGSLPDPVPALRALSVEGLRIEPVALRDLATVLQAASDLRRGLASLPVTDFPRLRALGSSIPDLRRECTSVLRHIGPDGRIADEASPELRRIRTSIGRTSERLRRMLESYLHDPSSAPLIRDAFVTQRNGRYVVPIRSDAPRAVQGIVHAASSSGATLFVEPMDSVELNNELVRLAEQEADEEDRVLRGWGDALRARFPDVLQAAEALAESDSLQAIALFAREIGGARPAISPRGGEIVLRDARHPLLDRRLRESGRRCVPITIELRPGEHVLVLSGPNAGGKTVALKTFGLAVLMAQTGLPVAAVEASIPVFAQVRADIGDHQSIEADLSTFSAHVQAVARFLGEVREPSLFLFDEIGTGTEPSEGGALARAVLETLIAPGRTTLATTHLAALKTWALTRPGAASAALEFDTETLQPTYRVLLGSAGVSAGLDIAVRMGLDPGIVSRAREHLGSEGRESESHLVRLRELTSDLARRQDEVARLEEGLREERRRLDARAAQEAEKLRHDAERALEEAVRELREQGRREIASIKDRRERARVEREQFRAEARLKAQVQRKTAAVVPAGAEAEASRPAGPVEPRPGLEVRIRSLDREGEIVELRGTKVVVRMGAATFSVDRSDLEAASGVPAAPISPPPGRVQVRRQETVDDMGSAPTELMLIGKTVDEGLEQADRFLDASAVAGRTEVRIVHGHGTGRLRAAIRRFLTGHPHVESHRPGAPNEGGDGATVVRLR